MARFAPAVRKEVGFAALWVGIGILPVQLVFWLLGLWDYTVLLGNLLGSATAVANVLMVGWMVQTAVNQTQKQAKNTVRLSQGGRLLLQGLILVLAGCLPQVFHLWATVIPLLIPTLAVRIRELAAAKTSSNRPAIGWDDENEDDEDEDTEQE